MVDVNVSEDLLCDAFEDVALLIGGVAQSQRLNDGVVWTLLRRLDRLRGRALARLQHDDGRGTTATAQPWHLHPAVEEFLRRNRPRGGGEAGGEGGRACEEAAR